MLRGSWRLARAELETLSQQIAGSNFLLAFADPDGIILDCYADNRFRMSGSGAGIVAGSLWREEIAGTNGLGTALANGRSVAVHPDEHLLTVLRERRTTPVGRARLRERVAVEHALAHIGRWQGRRARYRGVRKNLFDLRRCAVVHNLHVIARLPQAYAA